VTVWSKNLQDKNNDTTFQKLKGILFSIELVMKELSGWKSPGWRTGVSCYGIVVLMVESCGQKKHPDKSGQVVFYSWDGCREEPPNSCTCVGSHGI